MDVFIRYQATLKSSSRVYFIAHDFTPVMCICSDFKQRNSMVTSAETVYREIGVVTSHQALLQQLAIPAKQIAPEFSSFRQISIYCFFMNFWTNWAVLVWVGLR